MTSVTAEQPTTEQPTEPPRSPARGEARAAPRGFAGFLGQLMRDSGYLLLSLPMGILTFTVAVAGWSTAISTLLTFIGVPIAVAHDRGDARPLARRAPSRGVRPARAGARALRRAAAASAARTGRRCTRSGRGSRASSGPPDVPRPRLRPAAAADRHRRVHGPDDRRHDDASASSRSRRGGGRCPTAGTPASGTSTRGPTPAILAGAGIVLLPIAALLVRGTSAASAAIACGLLTPDARRARAARRAPAGDARRRRRRRAARARADRARPARRRAGTARRRRDGARPRRAEAAGR